MPVPDDNNPYRSPDSEAAAVHATTSSRNRLGELGFGLSLAALSGLWLIHLSDGAIILVLAAVPSTLMSLIALFRESKHFAAWGLIIGGFVCLNVPTLLLPFLR